MLILYSRASLVDQLMTVGFSKPVSEHSDLYSLDKEINSGEWFQLGGESAFPVPLKARFLSPPLIASGPQGSGSEVSFSSVENKEGNRYGIFVWKYANRNLSVKIGDGSDWTYCFEQGPQPFVTIQPLTDSEAQSVHIAAKSASIITIRPMTGSEDQKSASDITIQPKTESKEDVWHV